MKAPIKRNAGAFRRRFEATDRNVRVPGMRRACRIGFNICIRDQFDQTCEDVSGTDSFVQSTLLERQSAQAPFNRKYVGEYRCRCGVQLDAGKVDGTR
jgi:hypothetical protein